MSAPSAKIEYYHGEPAIMVDGVPYPPMTITTEIRDPDYLRRLGEAGIKLFYVIADMRWNRPGDASFVAPERKWAWFITPNMALDGLTETLADMKLLLENVPDAYIFLRLNVSPSREWVNSHPEEQVKYSDGKPHPTILTNASRYEPVDGMHSMCSELWRKEASEAIREYFDEITKHEEFSRVIGFFLCAGGTSEWYYPLGMQIGEAYGDLSEPFRRHYSRFLRERYGTEEKLRAAWKREDATFDKPHIPTSEERIHAHRIDSQIIELMKNSMTQEKVELRDKHHDGVFLNAAENRAVADFYDALHAGTADSVVHFAKVLKERFPELLVGAFYGAWGCTDYYESGTASGTLRILDSGYVDFLAAPGVYDNREPGGVTAQRCMQDSFRLRCQMFVAEDDIRTHLTRPDFQREASRVFEPRDTITVMKRDFARDLCEDIQAWWFDMGGDWYASDEIMSLFKRQQEIAKLAYSLDRTKQNDIALIYHAGSLHYVSQRINKSVLDQYRTAELCRIGAPVDYYFLEDMARENMRDYKLYVMLNSYALTDSERELVTAKARKNHATVLWLYGAGFIDPSSSEVISDSNISRTVGMEITHDSGIHTPYFRLERTESPLLEGAPRSKLYGYIDRDIHSNIWIGQAQQGPQYLCPRFTAECEDATVLGRFCSDGAAALAAKELDGYRSVWCATPTVQAELLRSIARSAGAHIFSYGEDVIYANESFVAIHAATEGKKRLYLKRKSTPYEVYERRIYGRDVDVIETQMELGETKMWSLTSDH